MLGVGGVWAFLIVWAMCGRFLRGYFTMWAVVGYFAFRPHFRPHIILEGCLLLCKIAVFV